MGNDLYHFIMCTFLMGGYQQSHAFHILSYPQLTQAEDAQRSGDLDTVYMCQQTLAQRFEQSKDTWLSDHFYQRSLETGSLVKSDNRRKEGEAHCHVGLALENRGGGCEKVYS